MKPRRDIFGLMFAIVLAGFCAPIFAQNSAQIANQRKKIAEIERQIANEEKNISKFKKDKSANEAQIRLLSRQIENRNDLLLANERQAQLLQTAIDSTDRRVNALETELAANRERYAEMVRESYRNYRNDNYISFIFSARTFSEMARRIAIVREVAVTRAERIEAIRVIAVQLSEQKAELANRKSSLDSVRNKISSEKIKMENDVKSARSAVKKLSSREQEALKKKSEQERKLTIAQNELARLTKGNTAGKDFSSKSKIDLPVAGGRRGIIAGDVCEIFGKPNAAVNSVYAGKVIAIKANRNRYEVYIAHGEESVSSYSNLSEVSVKLNQTVQKNQRIGTIGSWVNPLKSEPDYKILFQLQSATGKKTYPLASMFK